MCWTCVLGECEAAGVKWEDVEITSEMNDLSRGIKAWGNMPGNENGGVLHIVVEDMNVDDSDLDWCFTRNTWYGDPVPLPMHYQMSRDRIIAGLQRLRLHERALVIWNSYGIVS